MYACEKHGLLSICGLCFIVENESIAVRGSSGRPFYIGTAVNFLSLDTLLQISLNESLTIKWEQILRERPGACLR